MIDDTPQESAKDVAKRFREEKFAMREWVGGYLVATHLPPEKHGKQSTYVSYGCRCDDCTKAHREKAQEYRKKKAEKKAKEKKEQGQ
jgi:hypothetical protein